MWTDVLAIGAVLGVGLVICVLLAVVVGNRRRLHCQLRGHQWERLPTPIVGDWWWECRRCHVRTNARPDEQARPWWRVWERS